MSIDWTSARAGSVSLTDSLAVSIERHIVSGRLQHGDRLPAERELAAQLRVARGSLREALELHAAISRTRLAGLEAQRRQLLRRTDPEGPRPHVESAQERRHGGGGIGHRPIVPPRGVESTPGTDKRFIILRSPWIVDRVRRMPKSREKAFDASNDGPEDPVRGPRPGVDFTVLRFAGVPG